MRRDIENESDVKLMVDCFYQKVNEDELLGTIFNGIAKVNWDSHLSIMYGFWNNILFSTGEYNGRPFPKHLALPLTDALFDRWLLLFNQNLDELFNGPNTEIARSRAASIAAVFNAKYKHFKSNIN
ncbi:MAG: group III truncated hemoglobin [Salibacteraceae bacterium]|jgi:hemoglobin|nr:group III truncated hemoglobin [Salibacteraceae bacterium]MDP4687138.1 group III truncated hemoglobin [Salibacteraceae bacterium]MDP4843463.1 group III truncated hemoglobin [Salibacteraceae bacterium]MDP4933597.1 group III truncated hemoglobin [Salibacteraceae bacterium]MDP4964314.1 group III truncated hemoglobin [Salibacteraceae bacterium]